MKRCAIVLVVFCLLILVSYSAYAQEDKTRFGFGLSMGKEMVEVDDEMISVFDPPNFLLPILFGSGFFIEPEVGILRHQRNSDASNYNSTIIFLGVGFFKGRASGKLRPYLGARVGLSLISYKRDYTTTTADRKDSKTDLLIAPAGGVAFYIDPNFCIGGEFQLNYINIGQWDNNDDVSESAIRTKTLIFLRYFVN